ncbi:hypothetical protein [Paraburkholderia graminis]|uniref:hypothetical protein n=1 Tax=Paraburkholderia graminis TaxID=60548 RepID=UPI0031E32335
MNRVNLTVRFAPWVGEQYATEGFRGLRVLLVAESHYGGKHGERPTVTPEIVKALALGRKHPRATKKLKRHSHFAKIMTATSNRCSAAGFRGIHRVDFWERVAYFNFLQEFMRDKRVEPPAEAWLRGAKAFAEVLQVLEPELVVCFSSRMGSRVKSVAGNLPVAVVNHPSAHFAYGEANPVIQAQFERGVKLKAERTGTAFAEKPVFRKWLNATQGALPAHGPHLSTEELVASRAEWSKLMAALDVEAQLALAADGVAA